MKKQLWWRFPIAVALMIVLASLPVACGDDDDDPSTGSGSDDDECVAFGECSQSPALSDELSVMAFEVDPEPECAAFGLDVEVLEVRATENRGRMEARFRVNEANGNTFYVLTIASGPNTAYEDREFCYHEIVGTDTYVVAENFATCPSSMGIQFWASTAQWECSDSLGGAQACRFQIDVLPWPPEGQCVEDPQ